MIHADAPDDVCSVILWLILDAGDQTLSWAGNIDYVNGPGSYRLRAKPNQTLVNLAPKDQQRLSKMAFGKGLNQH